MDTNVALTRQFMAMPSYRGIRFGENIKKMEEYRLKVSIPSGRGICSGILRALVEDGFLTSQSPLIGAFVPAG